MHAYLGYNSILMINIKKCLREKQYLKKTSLFTIFYGFKTGLLKRLEKSIFIVNLL